MTVAAVPVRAGQLDTRRKLQLALAALWLLDGLLQYQPYMFSGGFPKMLAGTAPGNPGFVAAPVTWSAGFIGHHLAVSNAAFATIQVALALGIAWRPSLRLALAASVAWALGVWFLGEGLGGVLTGAASPLGGAPGAVVLYALLAVLLWPGSRYAAAPFVAGRAVGRRAAAGAWLAVWGFLAWSALLPAARAPDAASSSFTSMAAGQPGWLAWADTRLAALLNGAGLVVAILAAALMGMVAVGVFLPAPAFRVLLAGALVLAVFIWLSEGIGGILTGTGTDPNSAPLLVLLVFAFWPGPASGARGEG
jgi:hypothetical protein